MPIERVETGPEDALGLHHGHDMALLVLLLIPNLDQAAIKVNLARGDGDNF